jgi:hypothetical protein
MTSLDCRLLCACGCAYGINAATGIYSPPAIFSLPAGFIGTPVPFSADQINAALVGRTADGIVVAFRGTLAPVPVTALSFHDWLTDFFEVPKTAPAGPLFVPGQVHSGFYDATSAIVSAIAAEIKTIDPTSTIPVYVTGHSKGGAMASLGAYMLQQGAGIRLQPVVTFASPRTGDSAFKAGYESVLQQRRYENYGDLVPLVPPSHVPVDLLTCILNRIPVVGPDFARLFNLAKDWDYTAVGSLNFIEDSNDHYAISTTENLESQVLAVLEEVGRDLLARNFASVGDAHTLSCGYGYMSGTCPTGVCDVT